jgi:hypothetical protein
MNFLRSCHGRVCILGSTLIAGPGVGSASEFGVRALAAAAAMTSMQGLGRGSDLVADRVEIEWRGYE